MLATKTTWLMLLVLSQACLSNAFDPCSDIGGICQRDDLKCTGSYVTGMCLGDPGFRCCTSDLTGQCSRKGGTCKEDLDCTGYYVKWPYHSHKN